MAKFVHSIAFVLVQYYLRRWWSLLLTSEKYRIQVPARQSRILDAPEDLQSLDCFHKARLKCLMLRLSAVAWQNSEK